MRKQIIKASVQRIHKNTNRLWISNTAMFLKRSFLFAVLSATMLYAFVRLFFFEFPFTIGEGFELHGKILLVIWIFFIVCKLVFTGITLAEKNVGEIKFTRVRSLSKLKKVAAILLMVSLAYAYKTKHADNSNILNSANNVPRETVADWDNNFFIKLPS